LMPTPVAGANWHGELRIVSPSGAPSDLLELEDCLPPLPDADGSAGLGHGDGHGVGFDGDRRRGGVAGAETERQLHLAFADLEVAAGGKHHSRSEEHTSELQSRENIVCRLLLEKKN